MKVAYASVMIAVASAAEIFSSETHRKFQSFKTQYNRVYESIEQERSALAAFASNLVRIEERNALGGAVHGINQFTDLTPEEFKASYLNYKPSQGLRARRAVSKDEDLPAAAHTVDWANSPVTTPVKNQGRCGSCWAFSATEQIESVYAMSNGVKAIPFSTEQVVDCDQQSMGCNGGDSVSGYEYIRKFGGIQRASDYPDTSSRGGRTGDCVADASKVVPGTKVNQTIFCLDECTSGSCSTTKHDTEKAKRCITAAPQSICVNANPWQTYVSGVLSEEHCGAAALDLDHCVQVVGYNAEGEEPYYVVRNSWDSNWGYEGMIHLSMKGNPCGILDEMTTVTLQ